MEELLKAVSTGDLDKVQELVRLVGLDLTAARDSKGWMVLHHVAKSGNVKVAEYVIGEGVDVNRRTTGDEGSYETPLLISCQEGNMEMVKYLLGHGARIKAKGRRGRGVLHYACASNNLDLVEYLVDQGGADVNCKDTNDETPLLISCSKGNMDGVKYLLGQGADINARNRSGLNVLHCACESNNLDLVEYLIASADVNCKDTYYRTPLLISCGKGNMAVVKYLLGQGADINARNTSGWNVLHCACESNNLDLVEYLVDQGGADVNCKDTNDETPLLRSCSKGNMAVVKYLLEHEADINARCWRGWNVLHCACESNNLDLVEYLIASADVNCKDIFDRTPLLISCGKGNMNIVKYLLGHGADINVRNSDGKNVLEVMWPSRRNLETAEYLKSLGVVEGGVGTKTRLLAPPGLGSEITTSSITTTGATVAFDAPSTSMFQSFDSYKIRVHPSENGETASSIPKNAASPSSDLNSLLPGTEYTVAINVVKGRKEGPLKISVFTTKPPDIGSEIKITSISTTSATATFEPPSSGCFDRYSLTIHPSRNGETVTDIPLDAASPSSVLSNLLPGTKYKVTVNVVKRMDKGAETVKTFITTHIPSPENERRNIPCYKTSSYPRGLCIIINNIHFDDERQNRLGSDVDEEKLHRLFEELKFQVQRHRDLKADDINDVAMTVANQTDHSQYDCLVFCIMSHGIGGSVLGTDGQLIEITTITDHFKGINCKALREKPKIFFIQACKGTTHQMGFETHETDSTKEAEQLTIPNNADFLIGYSTVPGFVSYRHETEGSWYIDTLVKMLNKYCDSDDLLSIMTMVTGKVCKKGPITMKQCPLPYSTLRKKVFLKRD